MLISWNLIETWKKYIWDKIWPDSFGGKIWPATEGSLVIVFICDLWELFICLAVDKLMFDFGYFSNPDGVLCNMYSSHHTTFLKSPKFWILKHIKSPNILVKTLWTCRYSFNSHGKATYFLLKVMVKNNWGTLIFHLILTTTQWDRFYF